MLLYASLDASDVPVATDEREAFRAEVEASKRGHATLLKRDVEAKAKVAAGEQWVPLFPEFRHDAGA